MPEYSRRALLLAGGVAVGSAGIAASATTSVVPPSAAPRAVSSRSPLITQIGNPTQIGSIVAKTSQAAAQQIELTRTDEFFMTQSRGGTADGRYTTVISRSEGTSVSSTRNDELDAMIVIDGGHGLGLHVEPGSGGRRTVWASLQGANQQGDRAGGRLARFQYTPGSYTIDGIPGGVSFLPQFINASGKVQEAIYTFDWAKGVAVERMFDFGTDRQERYTRRRIADILQGADRPLGRITLPVNAPTLQGFATMNSTFFRWCGRANGGSGSSVAGDPTTLEQYDWTTGALVAKKTFATLGQDDGSWPDGAYEPEGCSVYREPDGTASLLVGVTTGLPRNRRWLVYKFPSIGAA